MGGTANLAFTESFRWKFQTLIGRAVCAAGLIFFALTTFAAEWQWSVPLDAGGDQKISSRAFLWIPPDCRQLRAVIVGQHNMLEEGIFEHPNFRKEMAKLGLAEIWITPTFDYWQNATNNEAANTRFNALLKSLAEESGYGELESAPVIPIGHSAMASYPWNFAAWNPERTLAILSIKGDAPQTDRVGNGRPNVDWGTRNVDGIPALMVMGEYEWWEDRLTPALKYRAQHPGAPIAMLTDAGRGHFDFSDQLVNYLALFIRKSVEQRLPERSSAVVQLKPIDPHSGWLLDRWRKDEKPHAPAAPFGKYRGDTNQAFWAFDSEMAALTEKFAANPRGKQPQLIGYVQDGQLVPQTPGTHEQVRLKFLPQADGITFKLKGVFLDAVADGSNPAKWTGLTNGAPLDHATGGGPIRISRIAGPFRQINDETFAVSFTRMGKDFRSGDIWLLAEHPGDRKFKSAVQQALLKIPASNSQGAEQHIDFAEIPNQKSGVKSLKLKATSDASVPVYFYVREGPAEISGDTLRFTQIPKRAKFPVKITVVAWQYGRSFEPKLKSAEPVVRTFLIEK